VDYLDDDGDADTDALDVTEGELEALLEAAFLRGREAGRAEGARTLKALSECNGETDAVLAFLAKSHGWDESKHNRDHGKFARTRGGKGDADVQGRGASDSTPVGVANSGGRGDALPTAGHDDPDARARTLAARIKEVPAALAKRVGEWVNLKYRKLSDRYGEAGAKAVLGAMVLLAPTPIPGSSLIPIALAEAVLRVRDAVRGMRGKALGDLTPGHAEALARDLTPGHAEALARDLLHELMEEHGDGNSDAANGDNGDNGDSVTIAPNLELLAAAVEYAIAAHESGDDPEEGLHRLWELDGDELEGVAGGTVGKAADEWTAYECPKCGGKAYGGDPKTGLQFRGGGRCSECGHQFSLVGMKLEGKIKLYGKAWKPELHPRGKNGRFIPKGEIEAAKSDPEKAAKLRAEVKPEDAEKLENALSGKTDLRNKREEKKDATREKRERLTASRDEARRLRDEIALAHRKGEAPDPEKLRELIPHLSTLTGAELRNMRTMLAGMGVSWGGATKVGERRQRLVEWAKGQAEGGKGEAKEEEKKQFMADATPALRGKAEQHLDRELGKNDVGAKTMAEWVEHFAEKPDSRIGAFKGKPVIEWGDGNFVPLPSGAAKDYFEHLKSGGESRAEAKARVRSAAEREEAEESARRDAEREQQESKLAEQVSRRTLAQHMKRGEKDFAEAATPEMAERWRAEARDFHRASVERALKEGKPVPASVLADYPDLAAQRAPASGAPPVAAPEALADDPGADRRALQAIADAAPSDAAREAILDAHHNLRAESADLDPADRRRQTVERLAAAWRDAHESGDAESAEYVAGALAQFGAEFHGPAVGEVAPFDSRRYRSDSAIGMDAPARVTRQPVVIRYPDGAEHVALEGAAEPAAGAAKPGGHLDALHARLEARNAATKNSEANALMRDAAKLTHAEATDVLGRMGLHPESDPVRQLVESIEERQGAKIRAGLTHPPGHPLLAEFEALKDEPLASHTELLAGGKSAAGAGGAPDTRAIAADLAAALRAPTGSARMRAWKQAVARHGYAAVKDAGAAIGAGELNLGAGPILAQMRKPEETAGLLASLDAHAQGGAGPKAGGKGGGGGDPVAHRWTDNPVQPMTDSGGGGYADGTPVRFGRNMEVIQGELGGMPITARGGLIEKVSKKTRQAMEELVNDPENRQAIADAGIHTIHVQEASGRNLPKGWTMSHADGVLNINPQTAERVAQRDKIRGKTRGVVGVLHHEAGHGLWARAGEPARKAFRDALAAHPEVKEAIAKEQNIKPPVARFDDKPSEDYETEEVHSELNAIRKYDPERFAALPEKVRAAMDAIRAGR
jgi:hypothetical protein